MSLSQELNNAFVQQIEHEYKNMLIYTQFESIFENLQLNNIAKYFHDQAQHEKEHGDKFLKHINDRTGGYYTIDSVVVPPLPAFAREEMTTLGGLYVQIEEETTESIESIYELALTLKSYVDLPILEEMLKEQVEEEDSASKFALNISMAKDLVIFDSTFGG